MPISSSKKVTFAPTHKKTKSKTNGSTRIEKEKASLKIADEAQEDSDAGEAEDEAKGPEDEGEVDFYGFSDDPDSSDEDDVMDDDGIDLGSLPTIAKDDASVKRRLEKAKRKPTEDKGVIYIGRLPHGFFEDQLRGYFSQFGDVTRLRLSRNKKTGRSKHYAFLEFDSSSVAQIVADTMNNYLLMGHILQCKVVPKDEVRPELWIGANRKWRAVPRARIARVEHNKPRTEEEMQNAENRLIKRQNERKRKLAEAGIKYNFDAVAYKKKAKPAQV